MLRHFHRLKTTSCSRGKLRSTRQLSILWTLKEKVLDPHAYTMPAVTFMVPVNCRAESKALIVPSCHMHFQFQWQQCKLTSAYGCVEGPSLRSFLSYTGSVNATQLATLFQNLGHPLPYDRLTKLMSEYDASKKGEPCQLPSNLHDWLSCMPSPALHSASSAISIRMGTEACLSIQTASVCAI